MSINEKNEQISNKRKMMRDWRTEKKEKEQRTKLCSQPRWRKTITRVKEKAANKCTLNELASISVSAEDREHKLTGPFNYRGRQRAGWREWLPKGRTKEFRGRKRETASKKEGGIKGVRGGHRFNGLMWPHLSLLHHHVSVKWLRRRVERLTKAGTAHTSGWLLVVQTFVY